MKELFEPAKKKKTRNIVVYEVNDSNTEFEFECGRLSGNNYINSCIAFIESLGFEISRKYEHSDNVIINGVEFQLDTDSASYLSKNAWSRIVSVRKPKNRFVTITRGYKNNIAKIYINQEIDADKLRERINAGINNYHALIETRKQEELGRQNKTIAIATHFLNDPEIKKAIRVIMIDTNTIRFAFHNKFSLVISADGKLISASFNHPGVNNVEQLKEFTEEIKISSDSFKMVSDRITSLPKLSPDLIEWITKIDNRGHGYHFDVQPK